jgi:hypothetical protein
MIFEIKKVFLSLDGDKIKKILLNPEFWENVVRDTQVTKKISVSSKGSDALHQEMILEIEIDSLGLIKRDIETIQDIIFDFKEPYESKEGVKIHDIDIKVDNSNQLRKFQGAIKIEEKPGKARLTFKLDDIGLKDLLIEIMGYTLTNRRLKRGLKKIIDKTFEYSETGNLEKYYI